MARYEFGSGLEDYVVRPADGLWQVAAGAEVTLWDAATDGVQYTDLLDANSAAISSVVADESGMIPRFFGPDEVSGMWADAGGTRGWMDAHVPPSKNGGYTSISRIVASATAPADIRAAATYVCDGIADQVQIQQAIADAQNGDGGGIVMLSVGDFNLTAPIQVNGTGNEDDPDTLILQGCGEFSTVLKPAFDIHGIVISNWAQCHIRDLGIVISGAGSGIVATAVTTGGDTRSFWDSSFRNLRINGSYTPEWTGWAMDLDMPFRSVFDNIEIEGTRNGIHLYNNSAIQNAGDCTFTRMFIEIVGADGVAIHVESVDGNMNQNNFSMVEAGAGTGGTGTTGILIDGPAGGASQRFWGTNLEQFATLVNVASGESNVFDLNYVTCRDGEENNKAFVCGTDAWNNRFSAKWANVPSGETLSLIEDSNTVADLPNIFDKIRIEANTGSTTTYSKVSSTVLRDIVAADSGTVQSGLLRYPMSDVNDPAFIAPDAGFLTWTQDPALCTVASSAVLAPGVVHLAKVKVVQRDMAVTHIVMSNSNAVAGLTAGQCFAGIYNDSGALLAQTADQSAAWATAGVKTMDLTTPVTLQPGNYWLAVLCNGSAGVPFVASGGGFAATLNAGASRSLTSGAGATTLPASITLGSATHNGYLRWTALS